jgi:hypothetical protein
VPATMSVWPYSSIRTAHGAVVEHVSPTPPGDV